MRADGMRMFGSVAPASISGTVGASVPVGLLGKPPKPVGPEARVPALPLPPTTVGVDVGARVFPSGSPAQALARARRQHPQAAASNFVCAFLASIGALGLASTELVIQANGSRIQSVAANEHRARPSEPS